jgi:hypothetical protein
VGAEVAQAGVDAVAAPFDDAVPRLGTGPSFIRGLACGVLGGIAIILVDAWVSGLTLGLSLGLGFLAVFILAACVGLLAARYSRGFSGLAGLLIGGYVGGIAGMWITNPNGGIRTGDVGFYDFAVAMMRIAIWLTWPVLTTVGYGVGRRLSGSRTTTPGGRSAGR